MKFPNKLQDILPSETVRQFFELVNQPTLVAGLKEAAQKMGLKDAWPSTELKEVLQQARQWLGSVTHSGSAEGLSITPVVNGTGEVFSNRWMATPMGQDALRAQTIASQNFSIGRSVESLHRDLAELFGAEAALVVESLPSAISLLTGHPSLPLNWIIPRADCIRLPRSCLNSKAIDLRDLIAYRQVRVVEVGASVECSVDDLTKAVEDSNGTVITCWPSGLDAPTGWSKHRDWAMEAAHRFSVPAVEVLLVGSVFEIPNCPLPPPQIKDRLSRGVDLVLVPGDGLVGGPSCGIMLGKSSLIRPLFDLVERLGGLPTPGVVGSLQATLEACRSPEAWQHTSVGEILCNGMANLENRASRLEQQLRGSPLLGDLQVKSTQVPIGASPWSSVTLPSPVLVLNPAKSAEELEAALQDRAKPIILRRNGDSLEIVLRTVSPADDQEIVDSFWPTVEPPTTERKEPPE